MNKFLYSNIIFASIFSCASISQDCVRVKEATYELYQMAEERGYHLRFQVKTKNAIPKYVVMNKIKQDIPNNATNGMYSVKVIAQTQRIQGYKVEGTNQENGIMFQVGSKEIYQKVNFKYRKEN